MTTHILPTLCCEKGELLEYPLFYLPAPPHASVQQSARPLGVKTSYIMHISGSLQEKPSGLLPCLFRPVKPTI